MKTTPSASVVPRFAIAAVVYAALSLVCPVMAKDYYVDAANGRDANDGTSEATAWQSLSKVSGTVFEAGDCIKFKRSQQFVGSLMLRGSGAPGNPITTDAYGTGTSKPIILGLDTAHNFKTDAIVKVIDESWWVIQNLEIQAPTSNGMLVKGGTNVTVQNIDFTNVMYLQPYTLCAEDGWSMVIGQGKTDGAYHSVINCTFISVNKGVKVISGDFIAVTDSYFFDVLDIPGLFAGHVTSPDHLVTNSKFARNIFDNTNNNAHGWNVFMFGGAYNCYFEFNEIKNSCPPGSHDHQVYDFDTTTSNCYIQYNYSHDNRGDFFHSYWVGNPKLNGPCFFRYNLSVGEKLFFVHAEKSFGLEVYNNTFYDWIGNFTTEQLVDTVFRNNIVHYRAGNEARPSTPAGSDHNLWFNTVKPATEAHSIVADPLLVDPAIHPHGLRLQAGSPAIEAGVVIAGYANTRDYWGGRLYHGAPDIGAHEFNPALPEPVHPNLAHRRPVTAGTSQEQPPVWSRVNLTDGSLKGVLDWNHGWSSETTPHDRPEWLMVDLGSMREFNKVLLYPRNDTGHVGESFPVDFAIETSTDREKWTTVARLTGYPKPADQAQVFPFASQTGRYVRINATALRRESVGYAMAFAELEVRHDSKPVPAAGVPSGNLALTRDVSASSWKEGNGWYRQKLVDGQRDSIPERTLVVLSEPVGRQFFAGSNGWSSKGAAEQRTEWVVIDLEAQVPVSRVDLYPRNDAGHAGQGFPADFVIQTSSDNHTWVTQVSRTGYKRPDGTVQSFPLPKATAARYVRILSDHGLTLSEGQYVMAFAEVEVY